MNDDHSRDYGELEGTVCGLRERLLCLWRATVVCIGAHGDEIYAGEGINVTFDFLIN